MQQVTLVLRGNAEDITDVIQLALAGGLLHSMTQDSVLPSKYNAAHQRRKSTSRTWTVGQHVVVRAVDKRKHPHMPEVGTEGDIVTVHKNGMRSGVTVRFKLDGKNRDVRVAGRLLKVVPS